ncbi:MAG: winged helix-turn-helix domain-containing protein [Candidatus Aenigmarchaeota archaeon]|nr:winged helix-turn-helix domain-containing protein [Candidatus Aenigmarchaeota archaeon]
MSTNRKSDLLMLFEIKKLIEKGSVISKYQSSSEKITQIHSEIKDLTAKFEELKDVVIRVKNKGDSQKKLKTKKEVISMLQKHKRLNPSQLAKIIGLSRVRANEYLRELEDEKIVKGIVINRKKFYMLEDDIKESGYQLPTKEAH